MISLDRAIKKTLAYSDFFDHPLSSEEIHFWLIFPDTVSLKRLSKNLDSIPASVASLEKKRQYLEFSKQKMSRAQKIATILSVIPTIHLVAVTGSVAVGSAAERDDIDLLIVTANHSLWLTRPFVLLTLSLFSTRRLPGQSYDSAAHTFCPNLWLEHRSLTVPKHKHNLYTAHEVLFVSPVFDRSHTHQHFLAQNSWVRKHLANAYSLSRKKGVNSPQTSPFTLLLIPFNTLFFIFQYLYMKPKITTEDVALDSAYFHTQNFDKKIKKHLDRVLG